MNNIDAMIASLNDGLSSADRLSVQRQVDKTIPQLIDVLNGLAQNGATIRQVAEVMAGLMARSIVRSSK